MSRVPLRAVHPPTPDARRECRDGAPDRFALVKAVVRVAEERKGIAKDLEPIHAAPGAEVHDTPECLDDPRCTIATPRDAPKKRPTDPLAQVAPSQAIDLNGVVHLERIRLVRKDRRQICLTDIAFRGGFLQRFAIRRDAFFPTPLAHQDGQFPKRGTD